MRTKVLNHFHTFYPEAQAEFDRLVIEEKRLSLEKSRQPDPDAEPVKPRRASQKLEPGPDYDAQIAEVKAAMDEQRAIIASGVVRIIIKGLTRGEYRALLVEHSAREGDALDARLGYNSDTFGDAFIQACILRTEDQNGNTVPNEWDRWADEMTNGQFEDMFRQCTDLTNAGQPSVFPR